MNEQNLLGGRGSTAKSRPRLFGLSSRAAAISKAIVLSFLAFAPIQASAQTNAEKLHAHSAEFNKEIITVTQGVHVAIGYALANSIMVEGDDGLIIIDTTENVKAAEEILAEFRKISDKPVKAIIYTHFHADHIGGAKAFAGSDNPKIFSHESTDHLASDAYQMLLPITGARSIRQFGVLLPPDQRINCGIGPFLMISTPGTSGYIPATETFDDVLETEIAGVKIKLVHQPGETDDQLFVWLPDKKVLFPGDNFYKSFPNLYAIRGVKYRDVREWANSIDKMLAEQPEFLVPSHTRPLEGVDEIKTRLTNYRDAIRFVHDTTVEGMNKGLDPDQLVEYVKLPELLAADPWLIPHYGTVEWSVRNIYNGYMGWFDANPAHLSPLAPAERAKRVAELAGGPAKLLEQARAALEAGDNQWALELTDYLKHLTPDDAEMKTIRKQALINLGEAHISANGRNYYLTSALQGI